MRVLVSEKVSLETVRVAGCCVLNRHNNGPRVLAEMSSLGSQWVLGMRRKWGAPSLLGQE